MSLSSDLLQVFNNMRYAGDGNNMTFAQGVMSAVRKSFESGRTLATIYSGSCSFGTVPGTVIGNSININGGIGEGSATNNLYSELEAMSARASGMDIEWVKAVTDACSDLVTSGEIHEMAVGTAIPPATPPPTIPAAGPGKGTLNDAPAKALLFAALMAIPAAMGNTGNDSIMANLMATAILAYFAMCIGTFKGEGPLVGLQGTNVMIANM